MTWLARIVAGTLLFQAAAGGARDAPSAARPLPDQQSFFTEIRQNLARSQDAQKTFSYKERRSDLDLNPLRLDRTCAANASCISIRSMSSSARPARESATGAANTGA